MRSTQTEQSRRKRASGLALELICAGALVAATAAVLGPFIVQAIAAHRSAGRVEALQERAAAAGPRRTPPNKTVPLPASYGHSLASWRSIGGCGVGGGGAGGGIRWIGRRGGHSPWDAEILHSTSSGDDLDASTLNMKFTANILWRLNFGLSIPLTTNVRSVDPSVSPSGEVTTEGMGDLGILLSRPLGMSGAYNASLTVTLPTAEYKRYDGAVFPVTYYPYDAQLGAGNTTASFQLERSFDRDWGPIILGANYTNNGGENDIGNMRGNTLGAYCYVGVRTMRTVHSLGLNISHALEYDREGGIALTDQSDYLFTLQYGMELSSQSFPLFMGLSTTLNDSGKREASTFALGIMRAF